MSHDLELLPCPFCGGEEIGISSASNNVINYMCLTCEGSGGYAVGDTESKGVWDEAHSLWNTRADPHQQALEAAREEGRRAGLEEAAQATCALWKGGREIGYYEGWDDALDIAEQRIRALAQTSTPQEGEE